MSQGIATLSMEQRAFEHVGVRTRPDTEVVGLGPVVATITGGLIATSPGIICSCPDLEAKLAACPGRQAGADFVQLQVNLRHGAEIAASFSLSLDDFQRLLDRFGAQLAIARFEAAERDGSR